MLKNDPESQTLSNGKGVHIDVAMFDLEFERQNFAAYRQSELDNAQNSTFTQMSANPMYPQ